MNLSNEFFSHRLYRVTQKKGNPSLIINNLKNITMVIIKFISLESATHYHFNDTPLSSPMSRITEPHCFENVLQNCEWFTFTLIEMGCCNVPKKGTQLSSSII